MQGERAASLISGGSFGFGIGAEVLFNKFALHVPLYRQQDPFAGLGWAPNRSTLCQIVINSAELLRPLAMLATERVLSSCVINSPLAMQLLPKSKLGQAVSYMRNNWDALRRFLSDGRLPIDNNEAERDLRRVAVGRKNWMFVGSEEGGERTAIIPTIVASAHRHDLDVLAYLRDVLERLARGEDNLEELLPDAWKAKHPQHVRDFRTEERQQLADERRYHRAKRRIETVKSTA